MDLKRLAAAAMTITFALTASAGSAFAAEKDDVVATVNQYLHIDKAETLCDSHVSILDEFPPHEWHGPNACVDWEKAYNAFNEKSGIKDTHGELGTPWTVEITGDRAYFVAPLTYTYKQHGKPVKETASFAVALRRTQAGWRITSWAYSKQTVE
jgi:hypothetical protein